ncbi:TolC family protein [bacterium]|nr:TolC family protein [bacterium]
MNKKLFIFMFLVMSGAAFAQDVVQEDVVVNEARPTLEEVAGPTVVQPTFSQRVKDIFSWKPEKNSANLGQEADAVEVDNDVLLKEQKKAEKELKKQQKQAEKAAKRAEKKAQKELEKNIENVENAVVLQEETPAVNQGDDNTVLTDTAYHASINTNRIMKVDECVKIALEKHPLIHLAMSNSEIYKSRIAQAWANYFPTFSAGLSYSRNDMQVANFAFPTQKYDMFYTPTVSANMLLFDFGKTKAQADLAKNTYESSQFQLQNSINTVIFTVKQSYYNLLFAQQQVKVYEDTVADYTLHLEQAKAYYDIGTKAKIDVLTAEHNLGKAKLGLIQAKNTLKIAYVQLSNAMGTPDVSDYDVTDDLTTKAYDIQVEDAVNTAFETSPELQAAKKKADASGILVRASKRAFLPDVRGFGGYTRGGKKIDTDYGYQFGAELAYKNVNLLLLKKQVDEARATYKKDLADFENTKQNIYFEVKQAYINLTNAQESIVVAKLSMDQAKEQYDQASGRYKVGLGDAIELKDAETTYRNSQLDYYNTLLNYHVSAANLEKLMGVPLQSTDIDIL